MQEAESPTFINTSVCKSKTKLRCSQSIRPTISDPLENNKKKEFDKQSRVVLEFSSITSSSEILH